MVHWQTHRDRWIDALGENVSKFITDFHRLPVDDTTGDPTEWTCTVVEAGAGDSTMALQDAARGIVKLTAAGNENDGFNAQLKGESFLLDADHPCYFGARWAVNEKTQSDAFVGLAITDGTLLAGNPDDMLGFITHDGDANLDYIVRESGTGAAVDTASDLVNDTYVFTEFIWDGDATVRTYLDGALIAAVTANIPDDVEMSPTLAYLNGAVQGSKGLLVDKIVCISIIA
jgi:hypothetical protein